MRWIELSVEAHPEAVDAVAEVFRQFGTGGVAIEQSIQTDREGEADPAFVGLPLVKAYLPAGADAPEQEHRIESALWHLQAFDLSPVGPLRRSEIAEEDWANAWKEHFHPLKIGRIVIKPTWHDWNRQPDEVVVQIDPGMAFGTGLHPTTSLMLAALQRHVRSGMHVLDLGTGSGILAIPSALLGARVTALDTSEVAVEVARGNVAANGLDGQIRVERGSIEVLSGQRFDLILANIIASVLVDLATDIAASLHPRAVVLGSGIIDERADEVRGAFRQSGLTLLEEEREGDWWLIAARASR